MKITVVLLLFSICVSAQKTPADFGYKELTYQYNNEQVKVLVRSKPGDENIKKPVMLYCQGSLPQPVLKYDHRGLYGVFPWGDDTFLDEYHLVVIGKPGVPIIADATTLGDNYSYYPNGEMSAEYRKNNHLDYYVGRNIYVLDRLLKEPWVGKGLVVVAHSEGTYVGAKMAAKDKRITNLILSSGNPYGRILSIMAQDRYTGNDEQIVEYWRSIVADKDNSNSAGQNDSFKTTYSFSQPIVEELLGLKIPVLFCYGTKDWSAPYNDLFQSEAIRLGNKYITFIAYRGLEHNYFPVDEKLQPDHTIYNWTKTGADWQAWLQTH